MKRHGRTHHDPEYWPTKGNATEGKGVRLSAKQRNLKNNYERLDQTHISTRYDPTLPPISDEGW